jgi:hypothetical protein
MAKLTKEQLAKLEGYEDTINDIRCDMIKDIMEVSKTYTEEVLENLPTDDLCTICISLL